MSENPYLHYLKYVRDVLGVHQMLTGSAETSLRDHFFHPDAKMELEQAWDVIFVNTMFSSLQSLFEDETSDLFQKMLKAMNLADKKVLFVDTDLMQEKEIIRRWTPFRLPQAIVIFKENPDLSETLRYVDDTAVVETYSPYHLRHFPEFKKITWNHLQKVMAHVGAKSAKN